MVSLKGRRADVVKTRLNKDGVELVELSEEWRREESSMDLQLEGKAKEGKGKEHQLPLPLS